MLGRPVFTGSPFTTAVGSDVAGSLDPAAFDATTLALIVCLSSIAVSLYGTEPAVVDAEVIVAQLAPTLLQRSQVNLYDVGVGLNPAACPVSVWPTVAVPL